jgi:hypothetical protein
MSQDFERREHGLLMTLRDVLLPRELSAADRWVCALVLVCFLWPGIVIFVEQTVIAVSTIGQSLGIAKGIGLFLGAYALIAYPLLRSAAARHRLIYVITIAIVLPVCLRFILAGVFLPGLRPSAGWLLRAGASALALLVTARWLRRRHLRYLVAGFVVITTAISWGFYYHGDWIVDLFMFRQALWTTLHGQGFFWVSDEGGSHFGTHNSPLLFLFLPLYAVWSSGALLLALQSIAVALSAYPMYGLARERLDEAAAMVVTVGFLLLTPVIGPTLTMFKELPFALPLFLAALLAFERGRLKGFAGWSGALLMVRETFAITVALFAVYALARRRGWRWVAAPAAMGLAWGALSFGVIVPHFFVPGQSNRPFLALYGGLGSNMQELVINVIKHPDAAWQRLYTRENLDYLEKLTRPFGRALPLGSVVTLFAAPDALMVGLSHKLGWPTHDVAANYHVIIAGALTIAFVYVLLGLKRRLRLSHAPAYLALGLFFVTALSDSLAVLWHPPHATLWPASTVRARREMVNLIPASASVNATYSMLMQLAQRREIHPVIPLVKEAQQWVATDYVVTADEARNRVIEERLRSGGYRLAAASGPFSLYQRPGAPPLRGQRGGR